MAVIIIILGFEYRRVLDGVRYFSNKVPIERIYLVYNRRKDVVGYASRRNLKDLGEVLSFAFKQPVRVGVNFSDPAEFFTYLYGIIRREAGKEIYVDITSTPPRLIPLIVLLALIFTNVSIYYVPVRDESKVYPKPGTTIFERWFERIREVEGGIPMLIPLPRSKLETPSPDEVKVLTALLALGGESRSIREIIEFLGYDANEPAVKTRFSRVINRLTEKGYLKITHRSKTKAVKLTEFGRMMALALVKSAKVERTPTSEEEEEYYSEEEAYYYMMY